MCIEAFSVQLKQEEASMSLITTLIHISSNFYNFCEPFFVPFAEFRLNVPGQRLWEVTSPAKIAPQTWKSNFLLSLQRHECISEQSGLWGDSSVPDSTTGLWRSSAVGLDVMEVNCLHRVPWRLVFSPLCVVCICLVISSNANSSRQVLAQVISLKKGSVAALCYRICGGISRCIQALALTPVNG